MSLKEAKARARAAADEEARQDEHREVQMEQRLRSWKRRTLWLGVALWIGAIVPFSDGMPLHKYAGSSTKVLVYLAMCLLASLMYAAGTTYVVWNYLRDTRKIHQKFAPPGGKYGTGA